MKIAQLSDIHIDAAGETPQGIDVRKNFIRILDRIKEDNVDLLVVTGDLCYQTPAVEIYHYINEEISTRIGAIPIKYIPGNHDDSNMLATHLGAADELKGDELYFTYRINGDNRVYIFLDTARGSCSDVQMDWLKKQIFDQKDNAIVVIFMHHPPVIGGVLHMDNRHAMKGKRSFQSLLETYEDHRFEIFCGHYHNERTISAKNWSVHICPSTFLQIDHRIEAFRVLHHRPGYRIIDINRDSLQFFTVYLDQ